MRYVLAVAIAFGCWLGFLAQGELERSKPELVLVAQLDRLDRRIRETPVNHAIYKETPGDDHYWDALVLETVVARVLRLQVVYGKPPEPNVVGLTLPAQNVIYIENAQHWNARYQTLAHEAGHMFMPPTFEPRGSESEMFAETVAFLLCYVHGLDVLDSSANYLAWHKQALPILRTHRVDLLYAVAVLR